MAIKHAFTSAKSDPGDATLIKPSDWNAGHTIDAATITLSQLATDATGMEFLGSTVLSAGAQTTATVTIAARELLLIQIRVTGYGAPGDIASLRFNGDTGTNYWNRFIQAAAGGTTLTNTQNASDTGIRLGPVAIQQARAGLIVINNRLATRKGCMISVMEGSADAATIPPLDMGAVGQWTNTAAQITSVVMVSIQAAANMGTGSGFAVWGKNI